jgi:outer membrane protein TolC
MTIKSKSQKPRSPKPARPNEIEERIRRRAYELYEQRDGVDGFALDDWLQAEREILGARKPKVKAARASQC